jgi:hypothetical protein
MENVRSVYNVFVEMSECIYERSLINGRIILEVFIVEVACGVTSSNGSR